MVLHVYWRHRRNNGHRGRRQDHARRPPGAGVGTSSTVRPGPGHRRSLDPGAGSEQVQPEAPSLPILLEPLDLDGAVAATDAIHTQTDTAEWFHALVTIF